MGDEELRARSDEELVRTKVDLLVIGGGLAGLSAAARALEIGASVVVVEKGPAVGGSALSAGFLWTTPTLDAMREINPDGDPELCARLVDGYGDAIEWVRSLGVEVKPPVRVLGYGLGVQTDMTGLIAACERRVRDSERGELLLGAQTERLIVEDADGSDAPERPGPGARRVRGAEVLTVAGERRRIEAQSTLLATGGFGGDPELRARHIHPLAREMPLRANPHSTGDGLRLGLSAGAAFGTENAGFYGHLVPSRVPARDAHKLWEVTFYHSEHGVLLNRDGQRFVDETIGDHLNTIAVLEQPEARALLVCDQRVHEEWVLRPYVEGVEPDDKFAMAYRRGARCAVAEDVEELEYLPDEWGYDGPAARLALDEFNQQCAAGTPTPSRRLDSEPLVDPPYYVIELLPAITFTFAGLIVDDEARVLDNEGRPIPGLLAAGADIGGLWVRAYAGGAAPALVFGLQAAATASAVDRSAAVH
jgi:succinate dehydrogenase/fumarate reductase flavoprotein subunit